MTYLINLIDVDGTQLTFSSELALSLDEAIERIASTQRYALTVGWHQAHIEVKHQGFILPYALTQQVTKDNVEDDVLDHIFPGTHRPEREYAD